MITQTQFQPMVEALGLFGQTPEFWLVRKSTVSAETAKAICETEEREGGKAIRRWWPKSQIVREETYRNNAGQEMQAYVFPGWLAVTKLRTA